MAEAELVTIPLHDLRHPRELLGRIVPRPRFYALEQGRVARVEALPLQGWVALDDASPLSRLADAAWALDALSAPGPAVPVGWRPVVAAAIADGPLVALLRVDEDWVVAECLVEARARAKLAYDALPNGTRRDALDRVLDQATALAALAGAEVVDRREGAHIVLRVRFPERRRCNVAIEIAPRRALIYIGYGAAGREELHLTPQAVEELRHILAAVQEGHGEERSHRLRGRTLAEDTILHVHGVPRRTRRGLPGIEQLPFMRSESVPMVPWLSGGYRG